MQKRFDVVGIGYNALDYLGTVPHLPAGNTKLEVRDFTIQGGDPTATAMVTLRRLGLTARYVGCRRRAGSSLPVCLHHGRCENRGAAVGLARSERRSAVWTILLLVVHFTSSPRRRLSSLYSLRQR